MTFDEIVGHDKQLNLLRRLIREETVGGTYLFSGPQHVGKETVAMALAKALLCEEAGRLGCHDCRSCRAVETLTHPDLTVLTPEGRSYTIGFEQIEGLRRRFHLSSFQGGWKVGIIRDAHNLYWQAAPALLKILEEPPDRSVFILISHKEDQILPTLRSRCKQIGFFPLSEQLLDDTLTKLLGSDGMPRQTILKLSCGRFGMAIRLARGEFLPHRDKILTLLENLSPHQFGSIVSTLEGLLDLTKEGAQAGSEVREEQRREERDLLFGLETLLRDVWIIQKAGSTLLLNSDRAECLETLARKWNSIPLGSVLSALEKSGRDLESNISLRLILENVFLTMGGRKLAQVVR